MVYWIQMSGAGRLSTMAKPRSGDWLASDLRALRQAGVDVIVSLLTYAETIELDLTKEAAYCQTCGIDFITFPIEDRQVPASKRETARLIRQLADWFDAGRHIAIHCRAGIGRSSLIAASLMTTYHIPAEEAFSLIETARGFPVPDTQEQKDWVLQFSAVYSTLL